VRFAVKLPDKHEAIGCDDEADVRRVLEEYRSQHPETLFGGVVIHEMREHSSLGTPRSVFDFLHED
jgi:hypothetical protein